MHQTERNAGQSGPAAGGSTVSATHRLKGLESPVEVHRDAWGIAHIRARNVHDGWFGLGYVHATDRIWRLLNFQIWGEIFLGGKDPREVSLFSPAATQIA